MEFIFAQDAFIGNQTLETANLIVKAALFAVLLIVGKILQIELAIYIMLLFVIYRIFRNDKAHNFYLVLILIPLLEAFSLDGLPLVNIVIAVIFVREIMRTKIVKINSKVMLFFYLFILYDLMHAFLYNAENVPAMIGWIIAIFYIAYLTSSDLANYDQTTAIKYLVAGVCISSVYGLFNNYYNTGDFFSTAYMVNDKIFGRFCGAAGDPNYFSIYLLIAVFSMLQLISLKWISTTKYITLFFILVSIGFMAESRMYVIVLLSILVIYVISSLASTRKNYKIHKTFVILLCIGALIGSIMFNDMLFDKFEFLVNRFDTTDTTALLSNRDFIFESYLDYINEDIWKILFGIGIQKYNVRADVGIAAYAHNLFIEIYVAWGIVGFFLFFGLLYVIYISEKRKNSVTRHSHIEYFPAICMVIGYQSLSALQIPTFYVLLLFAVRQMTSSYSDNIGNIKL